VPSRMCVCLAMPLTHCAMKQRTKGGWLQVQAIYRAADSVGTGVRLGRGCALEDQRLKETVFFYYTPSQ
jgi:hypothetical protein